MKCTPWHHLQGNQVQKYDFSFALHLSSTSITPSPEEGNEVKRRRCAVHVFMEHPNVHIKVAISITKLILLQFTSSPEMYCIRSL